MPSAAEVRALLDRHGLRARKSLGQNFLIDDESLDRIIEAADLSPGDTVLEIGPGLGALTRRLAEEAARVVAVELDPHLIPILRESLVARNVEIVHGDILQLDLSVLLNVTPTPPHSHTSILPHYLVVANLPYYITSAIIRHLLEAATRPARLILTVQLEVAQRLIAGPGDLSLLAISVQFYGRPSIAARIPARSFYPVPKVDSAVVRIDVHPQLPIDVTDVEHFFAVVKAGFGQKRKQLHNALKAGLVLPPATIAAALKQAGIDGARRAETLSLQEWAALEKKLPKT